LLDKGEGSFPGNGKPKQTPEEAEIARLKKALRDAEMERDILKKAVSIFSRNDGRYSNQPTGRQVHKGAYFYISHKMCKAFNVSRSGYYKWLNSAPSKRTIENQEILQEISLIHKESGQTYGSPRISKALKAKNIPVSRPRVARLMKQAELRAKRVKKFKVTTDSKHSYPVSENLLNS
jgi:hypothetical protein